MADTTNALPVRGFISYAHGDNDAYDGIVDRLKFQLETKFRAETGLTLELFQDRESIGWGEDWRSDINSSIRSGTLFIAVISMNYFASPSCREELIQFYKGATALGVTELLLPVVIAGKDAISADSPIEEVRIIEARQYVDLVDAYEAGFESTEWRRKVGAMVRSLRDSLAQAETEIAALEKSGAQRDHRGTALVEDDYDIANLTQLAEGLQASQEASVEAANTFVEVFTTALGGNDLGTLTVAQRNARMVHAAHVIAPAAKDFEEKATSTKSLAQSMDTKMRALFGAMEEFKMGDVVEKRNELKTAVGSIELGAQSMEPMEQAIEMMKFMGLVSVSLRKALTPGIRGIEALRDALAIIGDWKALAK